MLNKFYKNIFAKLKPKDMITDNKYFSMERTSSDESQCIVTVSENRLRRSKFDTYMLILDQTHVLFLKKWAVCFTPKGPNVFLDSNFWNVKEFGNFEKYGDDEEMLNFETWYHIALNQTDKQVLWLN